jgi:leucine dehydrogenase
MLHVVEPRRLKSPVPATTLEITDITAEAARLEAFDGHERIWLGRDGSRGLTAIVAVHDTTLGPALGGTRVWPHESFEAALTDALRLSRGMTLKAAIAGVPFGGGKAVIIADSRTDKTHALLDAYAEMLATLDGQYYTGEDVGLTLADADYLRARTPNVSGTTQGGSGNPSPVTAQGVFLGLKAALAFRTGGDSLAGVRVAVQGLGSVGWSLCRQLHEAGAQLIVADIDPDRVTRAAEAFGAEAMPAGRIVEADADIFAPCALGGILSAETIPQLRAGIVAGAANNQLARHEDARLLLERGVLYAPDYVINAGGLMNVAAELDRDGYDRERVMARLAGIPATLNEIFAMADKLSKPTNDVAQAIAQQRIAQAGRRAS